MCNPTCKVTTVLNVAIAILEASLGSAQDISAAVCEIVAARPRTGQGQHINLCFDLLSWWPVVTGTLAWDMTSTISGFRWIKWPLDVHSTHMESLESGKKIGKICQKSKCCECQKSFCPGRLCNPHRSPGCSPMDHLAMHKLFHGTPER